MEPVGIKQKHRDMKKLGQNKKSRAFYTEEHDLNVVVHQALEDIPKDVIQTIMTEVKPYKKQLFM
jgi:hypothetical protein